MFGEVPDPLPETTALVEDIVRGQVIEMITQATQHAIKRGSRSISVEDLIFLIRHDKPKVNRLKTYLSWKDVRKNAKEQDGVESPEIIDGSDLPWDLYFMFSESVPFNFDDEDDYDSDEQESNFDTLLRLRFADLRTRTMTKDEYVHYSECRQASFTYRKSKRFREWSGMNQLMDCRPNDDIIDILGFLTFEIVATITEESLRVKAQMDSLEESDIFKEKGEKYLFDNPEESRTPLQVKHIEEGFRRLQEPQPKHIVMRGFDGGLVKSHYIARSFESNFIVINSSGSEEEPLSNDSVNLDKPINSSLLENDYNIDKNEFQELHTENLCLKGDLKSRKQGLFNKNSLESTNITLNDILSTEGHTQDKFLSGIAKSDINDNTLNECKLKRKKKNYVFKRKKLFKIIKTKKKINFKETIIPNFQKYTFVELQSEISKYGFKTMRSKKAIIELLTKCWKMSNSLKQKQLIENDKESNEFDSFQILNNILSEQSISDALQNCTLLMYFGNGLQCIFLTITKILKSSSGEIYWSKILRYEPIVLETFAKWLFEQNIVVTLDILKQYCNIHGICSVHFKTNRGSAKKYL
ncbi:hypothetical protein PCANB_000257 [Pneumocystis canis]|nr:hypothetical protein PCANB_000257 [Pneumocystis canis]